MEGGDVGHFSIKDGIAALAGVFVALLCVDGLEWLVVKLQAALLERRFRVQEDGLNDPVASTAPSSSPRPPPEVQQNRSFDVIKVALDQMCGGGAWYTSTKELQLTSLQFCAACRSFTTLTLTIETNTATSLVVPEPLPPLCHGTMLSSRVPHLRARRVKWNLFTAEKMTRPLHALTKATAIEFGDDFLDLRGVYFFLGDYAPFSGRRSRREEWTLRSLLRFRAPLYLSPRKAAFPATPRHFTSGHSFDQGLKRIVWPASLQQLTFGKSFHQPIENVVFPQSLQQLTLGHQFNHPIHRVQWPASLRRLTFGTHFDQEIGGVTWPNSLTKLTFGVFFNKTLQGVVLPVSLAELTLGSCFQQPIEGVTWPNSLRQLEFGRHFNQPVEKVNWPKALRTLSFECDSDHPFWYGLWPPLESRFDQPLDSARWPLSLRRLSVGGYFNQSLQGLGTWMPNLEELRLVLISGWTYRILLGGIEWPKGLRELTVAAGACLQGVAIPPTVEVVYVEKKRYGT